jgi:hypothetical protein
MPIVKSWMPEVTRRDTTSDAHPTARPGFQSFSMAKMTANIAPANALKKPRNVAKRKGRIEKLVNIFNHSEISLIRVYPDLPEDLGECCTSTLA